MKNAVKFDRIIPAKSGNIPKCIRKAFGGDSGCEILKEGEVIGFVPNFPSFIGDEVDGVTIDGTPIKIVG